MNYKIKSLHIYPLKSGRGINLLNAKVTLRGLKDDRLWMLLDANGKFLTQRQNPKMATLVPAFKDGLLQFDTPGMNTLSIANNCLTAQRKLVEVWSSTCQAIQASEETAQWFSDALKQNVQLVRIDDSVPRTTDPVFSRSGDQVSFADGYPILVTSQASLDRLHPHFEAEVGMERFRPNVVLEGGTAFAEDTIHVFSTNSVELECVKHCKRCPMPLIDQITGEQPSREPNVTLGKFRYAQQNSVPGAYFGVNTIPRRLGHLTVGDVVTVASFKPPSLVGNPKRPLLTMDLVQ